ncbi:MAG: ClpXP protease specificity-enhancing factor [Gammaproteobacteria bacterium]|nr:ClpXP protease specificity-enhancing factor [Gammaproteobacteria bacterium]
MSSSKPYLVRAVREWILDNHLTPYILVQIGFSGMRIPEAHADGDKIVLNISESAVTEFVLDNDHLSFLARFGGKSTDVCVPVEAILAIYARENGEGMVFDRLDTNVSRASSAKTGVRKATSGKPHLELIKS